MWKFWKSKSLIVEQPQKSPELSVAEYTKDKYNVYWETHLDQVADGTWTAEVRFVGWGGFSHRSQHNIYGPTKENVESLVHKLITESMETFRK